MPTAQLEPLVRYLRRHTDDPDSTDAALLRRFVAVRDEAAFETLVRRHGPLVLSVCRRMLRDPHAAEDSFQATFLVLARKAGSLIRPERLGSWLAGEAPGPGCPLHWHTRQCRVWSRTRRSFWRKESQEPC